jgi:methionine synthase I (cobalamin-dependent)
MAWTRAPGRPLALDGGMGVRLMSLGLDLAVDDPTLWNETHPDAVQAIHAADVAAGADVLLTNTFGANATWLARFGRGEAMVALNRRALQLARDAAGPETIVLGSIGPTAGDEPAYQAQAEALAEADGLVLETHTLDQALRALAAIRPRWPGPIVASLVGMGDDPVPAAGRLVDSGADAVGVNCLDPAAATAWLESIAAAGPFAVPLWIKPAAADPAGGSIEPSRWAEFAALWVRLGATLIGGCCGATDAHVAAVRRTLDRPGPIGVD